MTSKKKLREKEKKAEARARRARAGGRSRAVAARRPGLGAVSRALALQRHAQQMMHPRAYPIPLVPDGAMVKCVPFTDQTDFILTTNTTIGNAYVCINTGNPFKHTYRAPVWTATDAWPITNAGSASPMDTYTNSLAPNFNAFRITKVTIELTMIANASSNQGVLYVLINSPYSSNGAVAFPVNYTELADRKITASLHDNGTIVGLPYTHASGIQFLALPAGSSYADPPLSDPWPQVTLCVAGAALNTAVVQVRIRTALELVPVHNKLVEKIMQDAPLANDRKQRDTESVYAALKAMGSEWFPSERADEVLMEAGRLAATYGPSVWSAYQGFRSSRSGLAWGGLSTEGAGSSSQYASATAAAAAAASKGN